MPKSLHESELKDILTTLADIKDGTFFDRQNKSDRLNQSSISRATKDLVMSFPVLCEDIIDPSTASMICKAIERKAITMFQILFSANQMKASGGVELLKKWHNNVAGDFDFIDNYMDAMDFLSDNKVFESTTEKVRARAQIIEATRAIEAENKRPGKVYLSSISETSLNEYKVFNGYGNLSVIVESPKVRQEAKRKQSSAGGTPPARGEGEPFKPGKGGKGLGNAPSSSGKNSNPDVDNAKQDAPGTPKPGATAAPQRSDKGKDKGKNKDKKKYGNPPKRDASSAGVKASEAKRQKPPKGQGNNGDTEKEKNYDDEMKLGGKEGVEYYTKQLLSTDVKKANELVPSLMIVRFAVQDPDDQKIQTTKQFVAGVKARLIPIDSYDLFDRIESKNRDRAGLVQFVRATTKEISFVKDYLLAIDQAKMDAVKTSRNKTNGIFKTLEKRATKSVFNRLVGKGNDAGCITTIVMSQTSVDYLKKEKNIKMDDPRVASKIMDAYNLLCFVIVDESIEVARFLFDGDSLFEQLSFSSLEKESGDGSYKKMINLLSKMNR